MSTEDDEAAQRGFEEHRKQLEDDPDFLPALEALRTLGPALQLWRLRFGKYLILRTWSSRAHGLGEKAPPEGEEVPLRAARQCPEERD